MPRTRYLLIFLMATLVGADDIDLGIEENILLKAVKEVSNQNKTDTLNLPANASSIRENITDTFSCENRTYGYYADVDNECQVFHVCLPSQTPSGRNVTYRWSFICPNETIFNQEVLTCTRPADSINCEDSPMFYHLNTEIGKVSNKTEEVKEKENKSNRKQQKRKTESKKENIIMENSVKDALVSVDDVIQDEIKDKEVKNDQKVEILENNRGSPMLFEAVIESVEAEMEAEEERNEEDLDRIIMERNVRQQRRMGRGNVRFRGDA